MQLGRYEIDGELGRGAMGVVYLATDPTIGRKVAIKTLIPDPNGPDVDALKKRFAREARAAGVLTHPAIVTVHDVGEDAATGNPYMAMEYLEGVNLAAMMRAAGKLPVAQTLDILRQVASGLDFAHARGVVHRDIKPANIVVLPTGQVKITDFGIAKLEAGAELTQAGHFLGTPSYTAPEQLAGQKVDGAADIYSLAIMAYEMLSGKRPFAGDNFTTLMYQIMNAPPPEIPDLSPRLNAAFKHALAKNPRARPATAEAMVAEIAAAMGGSGRTPSARAPATVVRDTPLANLAGETRIDPRRAVPAANAARRSTVPALVLMTLAFGIVIVGIAGLMIYTLRGDVSPAAGPRSTSPPRRTTAAPPAGKTIPASPSPGKTTPASPPASPPATPSPTIRVGDPSNAQLILNVTIAGIATGSGTIVLDGYDYWTHEFSRRPAVPGGSKTAPEPQGYLKQKIELPGGSHKLQLRIEGAGKTLRGPTMHVDLDPQETVELKARVERGQLTAEIGAAAPRTDAP
ncbi:MAG: serine/threonine-protein kinase [Acidobacteriota bacterium]